MHTHEKIDPGSDAVRIAPVPPNPVAELEKAVALIRDQVDALQITVAEEKQPWYRDHSAVLSILALILSTVFSVYSVYQSIQQSHADASEKAHSAQSSKLETLRQFMLQAATIRSEEIQEEGTLARTNPVLFGQRSSVRNLQRQIILENADAIVGYVRDSVSAQLYNALAFEHSTDGQYAVAEQYYLAALKAATDSASRVVSLRGLASLYMAPRSPITNVSKGRELFRQVIEIISRQTEKQGITS